MASNTGVLRTTGRPPSNTERAVWLLWIVAVVCGAMWARGLFFVFAAGPEPHIAAPDLAAWPDLSGQMLRDPFQALSLVFGPSRAHRLAQWASSSYALGAAAEASVVLSLYLRRRIRRRVPSP